AEYGQRIGKGALPIAGIPLVSRCAEACIDRCHKLAGVETVFWQIEIRTKNRVVYFNIRRVCSTKTPFKRRAYPEAGILVQLSLNAGRCIAGIPKETIAPGGC